MLVHLVTDQVSDPVGQIKADHKVLVLGDMFEIGDESPAEHEAVIKKALETQVGERIFIGKEFDRADKSIDHRQFGSWTKNRHFILQLKKQ